MFSTVWFCFYQLTALLTGSKLTHGSHSKVTGGRVGLDGAMQVAERYFAMHTFFTPLVLYEQQIQ